MLYVSYLGTLHGVVEVEMALREWLQKQSRIYRVVGICGSLQEGTVLGCGVVLAVAKVLGCGVVWCWQW